MFIGKNKTLFFAIGKHAWEELDNYYSSPNTLEVHSHVENTYRRAF